MVPDIHGGRIFLLASNPPAKIDYIYLMIKKIKLPEIRILTEELSEKLQKCPYDDAFERVMTGSILPF